ncbi:CarboxypepD_reg-like domain-containing protein [Lutibacter oricola]|uniref:CarboxypepD_reg-like domain-containing protein n=1 Tax=Lutibacter oricola TaxID=762486 RepID=A0A1H3F4G8_9FLAO|nr:carboxypeptidase-like regulatory domain-containing protein [Lutibacter oricola]SDX85815.1 CarboxypepD_reg-like domain-containing protein [Lutibacter oricola]
MRFYYLSLFFLTQIIFSQSKDVSGVVKDTSGPLPGAQVVVKGTSIGTQTNFDGYFKLHVPDSINTLVISFVGYETKEVEIIKNNEQKEYVLEDNLLLMKEVIAFCYFYPRYIGLHYFGGVNHSMNGISIKYFDPYLLSLPFISKFELGYQIKNKKNNQLYAELGLINIFYFNKINVGVKALYSKINVGSLVDFESVGVEVNLTKNLIFNRNTILITGFGKSNFKNNSINNSNYGYTIGVNQNFPHGIKATLKTTNWQNYWQLQTEVKYSLKEINMFYKFNKIENYIEHNIGIGYNFNF